MTIKELKLLRDVLHEAKCGVLYLINIPGLSTRWQNVEEIAECHLEETLVDFSIKLDETIAVVNERIGELT